MSPSSGKPGSDVKELRGLYSVSSAYDILEEDNSESMECISKNLWGILAPSNTVAFGWRMLHNSIQNRGNLRRRHMIRLVEEAIYLLFLTEEETISHLQLFCSFAWNIWMTCYNWLGISTVIPEDGKVPTCVFLQV